MTILGKVKKGVEVLQEAWLVGRVPPNEGIFDYMNGCATERKRKVGGRELERYLKDHPAMGEIHIAEDWFYHRSSGEMRLTYTNTLFAPGCLRLKGPGREGGIIVFWPGYQDSADDVLGSGGHPQSMTDVADELGMGIACHDWLLQGHRRDACLYRGLKSVYSGEREYSRILPALGTSLWREQVAELVFALERIRSYVGHGRHIHVIGWSMGGCFAYLAPLLGTDITTTIAAGSCARIKDLFAEGKTRLHGYFFYPLDGLAYFDLDNVVGEVLARGHMLQIIHGEHDRSCLQSTRDSLVQKAAEIGRPVSIDIVPSHGHVFSPAIKRRIVNFLSRYCSKSSLASNQEMAFIPPETQSD